MRHTKVEEIVHIKSRKKVVRSSKLGLNLSQYILLFMKTVQTGM